MQNPAPAARTPVISVFGSSSPLPGNPDYEAGVAFGRALALAGFAAQTGGYMGLMEAVSRGASEAGGHVIGITSRAIEDFRPAKANPYVREEIQTDTLAERLVILTRDCVAAVVLPGGVGTLTELALVWNQVLVGELAARPIVAVGDPWRAVLAAASDPRYTSEAHAKLVTWVPDVQAAAEKLVELRLTTVDV